MSDWQLRQLRELFEYGEKIFLLDEPGDFPLLQVDDAFCRMLGFEEQQDVFMFCRNRAANLIDPPDIKRVRDDIREGIRRNQNYVCHYRMTGRDGDMIRVRERGVLITGGDGKACIQSIVVNVTEEETSEVQKVKEEPFQPGMMASDARELTELRLFYAAFERELRSLLQFIQSTIQRNGGSAGEEVIRAVSYMYNVLNTISEYEKLEKGEIRFESRCFSLESVLEECFTEWKEREGTLGVQFQYHANLQGGKYYGDERRIAQMLNHVIGNCMMASEMGKRVEIWADDMVQEKNVNKLTFVAEDWGVPLREGFLGREETPDTGKNMEWKLLNSWSGTTFSLVIAKKLANLMGGQLRLSRKADTSNVLTLEILLHRNLDFSNGSIRRRMEEEDEPQLLEGYTLLLVQNRFGEHKLSGKRLKRNGAEANEVSGGEEALGFLRARPEYKPDALLVEGNLGDMDYLAFTAQLRGAEWELAGKIPVIVILNEVSQQTIYKGLKTGVNSWLDTPTDMKRLRLILEAVCRNRPAQETDNE